MNTNYIKSTLAKEANAKLSEIIPVEKLILGYQERFNIDISAYFEGINEINIYECEQTKYRFYYPFGIDGDGKFYEHLQKFDWYYMPWKWEHEKTVQLLNGNEKILEVGSGGLDFVERLSNDGFEITGLEINEESIIKAKNLGLNVLNETVQDHAKSNYKKYDLVCSFQVLEHITEVNSFIKAQIDCLKPGGKLIICVPNNDSFIKLSNEVMLNYPPHHMGLWNKESLSSLSDLFNLKVDKVFFEPLQEYHLDWYINSNIREKINKNTLKRIVFNKLKIKKLYTYFVKKFSKKIHGHSILMVYTKI